MRAGWKKFGVAMLAATAMVGGAVGCSSSSDNPDEILVYNAQHESLTKEWIDAFTKETGIKVTVRQGGDTELGNLLVTEGDKSPADVFLTENSPAMALVENAGLFADVDKATLDQVLPGYRPSTGKWTGIAGRSTVFVYNKDKLSADQLPKSIMDLADPSWKGRWAGAPSGADFQAIVSAILELKGEDATRAWLKAMKENADIRKNNIATMMAANAGEIPGGIMYHYYWFGDQAKTGENSNNTALHYFKNGDPGAFVSVSGGGVLKSSGKQEKAQQFLKFITGKAGQEVLKNGTSYEYPVASGVAANPKLVPLADLQAPLVDPSKLNSKKVTDLMTEAGLL
ncbi:iron ABC transporter substrate-binding protein [Antrihabitans stalactiti]|uniref:Iron ABC transporter substrate-binding protein n=1 Tax=Antrihabitans stalactiti TaxID=2584121 RepID=A0A848KJT1_9NOCA|nr:iron ABC transporter substrate-binding protein [Antrihabitans stalactiti]NMN98955.1 iron ABC transporter substrate-binding protein [Antrihabitans stalactiti]